MLFRNLEENGDVAGPEAVPGVKQMREKREGRRLLQGHGVPQIRAENYIEELKLKER